MFVQLTLKFCQFLWYCPGWFFCFCIVVIYPTGVCLVLLPRTRVKLNLTKWYKTLSVTVEKPSKTPYSGVMSLHKHFVMGLCMYPSRSLKFCWFLPSRNFGFSVVEVCSTIRCLVLCPWGLLLQIDTRPSQFLCFFKKKNMPVQSQIVCALVELWVKNLKFETLQGHCHLFAGKPNYSGGLLLGQRLKNGS